MIKTLVLLHVVSGSGAIIGLIGALIASKGGVRHRLMGRLYSVSMAIALLLAFVVSAATANAFLFLIGLFSAYFVYTGWRLAVVKDGVRSGIDRRLAELMVLSAVAMIGYGAFLVFTANTLGVALAVFGVIGLLPAWGDVQRGQRWPEGKNRIVLHLNRMGGAGIASITAVFVVNVQTNPGFIAWLLPTIVGTPVVIYWTRKTLGSKSGVVGD